MTNVIFRPITTSQKTTNLKSFLDHLEKSGGHATSKVNHSKVLANFKEYDDRYLITLAVSGFSKSDISLKLEQNLLTITGKKDAISNIKFIRKEFNSHEFSRTIALPKDINLGAITASCNQGVLEIQLPKADKPTAKTIEVQ